MDNKLKNLQSEGDLNLTQNRVKWLQENINQETNSLLEEDSKYFLHQSLSTPCLNALKSCDGIYIEDTQGRKYMDFHGNNVHQVGYKNPAVIKAIQEQIEELAFCPRRYTNETAVAFAKKLVELAPGSLNKVLFAPGGTSAIGMALKLARVSTGRFKTISMWDSFHGASLDAISIGGETIFRSGIGPLLPGAHHVPPPDPYRCFFGCEGNCTLKCADYIEYILKKEGDVAAVVAETIRSTSLIPPDGYWQNVREACDRHGALLIFDEIPHCLGRTGKMFTFENFGVIPDMVTIGKGLGGGIFPLAALIAKEELDVAKDRAMGHYTHEKSPVACAAGLAAIEYIEIENLLEKVNRLGEFAQNRMHEMKDKYPLIGEVRGIGLFLGMELVKDRNTREPANEAAEKIMYDALERGLSFKVTMGNILTLTPPLIITESELDNAFSILEECFEMI